MLVENELKKLKILDLSYFGGKNYFEGNDGVQNALLFQTMPKYFDLRANQVSRRKSNELPNQFLNLAGTVGDIILSKSIKPMDIIFSEKGLSYQKNIYIL